MSLEQAIADLTAAVNANTAALSGKATTPAPEAAAPPKAPEKKSEKKSEKAKPASAPTVSTKQVADELVKLANLDKPRAVALLKEFGVSKLPEMKPEKYAEFLPRLQAAVTELTNKTDSLI